MYTGAWRLETPVKIPSPGFPLLQGRIRGADADDHASFATVSPPLS